MSKRIAIIGSGISGLVSAYLLHQKHQVTLFEANDYLGGHTNTVNVTFDGQPYAIDTGFIVFNEKNYPNFRALINKLNIPIKKSEMSFSFQSDPLNIEYNISSFKQLIANKKNLIKPAFYKMLIDILRFNQQATFFLNNVSDERISLREFLAKNAYSRLFIDAYLRPMISAIWSMKTNKVDAMPAKFALNFFSNHGLLTIGNRPQWYVIENGSSQYVAAIAKLLGDRIRVNTPVSLITRKANGIMVKTSEKEEIFDAVIVATHSDQALKMLRQPKQIEIDVLSKIHYQTNEVVLHYDHKLLPKIRQAWASWNYRDSENDLPSVTYYMNRLQNMTAPVDFCVSVNQTAEIHPEKIIDRFQYAHPVFNQDAMEAQKQYQLINGVDRIYFCGAYWGHGFHEDGVKSALAACKDFEVAL